MSRCDFGFKKELTGFRNVILTLLADLDSEEMSQFRCSSNDSVPEPPVVCFRLALE
jgi:hypothetical protein